MNCCEGRCIFNVTSGDVEAGTMPCHRLGHNGNNAWACIPLSKLGTEKDDQDEWHNIPCNVTRGDKNALCEMNNISEIY